jgi:hypothetical protein
MNTKNNAPLNALRHHVTGAIERGEKVAIAGIPNIVKHTMGPWIIDGTQGEELVILQANDAPETIASLGDDYSPENMANARLIAAAPELLEALQAVLEMDVKGHSLLDRLQFSPTGRALSEKCLSAIAKAVQS